MTSRDRQRRVVAEIAAGAIAVAVPTSSAVPVISGTPNVGQVQTCSTGTWAGGGQTYAYQWKLGGTSIGGATANTFTPTAAGSLTCTVTATSARGTASATSAPVTIS